MPTRLDLARPFRGLAGLVCSMPYFYRYGRLQKTYGFDPWHVRNTFPRRPYKSQVVKLVDGFRPETVVEIGCGLGEIVSRTAARHRYGFDRESAVVAAATRLWDGRASFHHGDLHQPEAIAGVVGRPIDVLVMVNWPHMIAIDELVCAIAGLRAVVPVSVLIMDTIRRHRVGYAFHHAPADIARLGTIMATRHGGDDIRDLHAVALAAAEPACGVLLRTA